MTHHIVRMIVGVSLVSTALATDKKDWPQFRGPNRDGIGREATWNPQALTNGGIVAWRAQVGNGYSSVVVAGNKAFTLGNKNNQDTLYALNLQDGRVIWQHSYPCNAGSYPGPRATPATDGTLVYTFSREGDVFCLDAVTGAIKWQQNVTREFKAKNLGWGFSASPVIKGDTLLLNACEHGLALNRLTGAKIWASPAGTGGYAAPLPYTLGGKECLAIFGAKALHGVDLHTGEKLWSIPWETSYDVNAADPIYHNGKIFISSGYGKGATVVDITGTTPRQVWTSTLMRNQFSSCVLIDGHLYGIDGNTGSGSLKCIDFATGTEKWTHNLGFGSLTAAGDRLIVLNDKGDLFVIKAAPTSFEQLASAEKVLPKTCWTTPVLCRGLIFCRNDKGDMVALDVRK